MLSGVDPGGGRTFSDCDLTSSTSALATIAVGTVQYNSNASPRQVFVRRNGDTTAAGGSNLVAYQNIGVIWQVNAFAVPLDDGNIFEYATDAVGANTEQLYYHLNGYWEWA